MAQVNGFDVSHFQKTITWPDLPLEDVKFCFVKATDGASGKDRMFTANWAGAKSAGLIRGAYHFFRPGVEVADQVANFTAQLGTLDPADLPPALDLEIPEDDKTAWDSFDPAQAAALALDWLSQVQQITGRKPLVYTNLNFYRQVLGGAAAGLKAHPLWIARVTGAADPGAPSDWPAWTFWQFSFEGKLRGIDTAVNVDLNRFNGNLDDLNSFISASMVLSTPDVVTE